MAAKKVNVYKITTEIDVCEGYLYDMLKGGGFDFQLEHQGTETVKIEEPAVAEITLTLPEEYKRLVEIALSRLTEGSELDLKPAQGRRDVYRVRVGRYRVLFRKLNTTVLVFRISPRGDVYR